MDTLTVMAHFGSPDPARWMETLALTGTEQMREATLTTLHARSSYGMPVLVMDGVAYGPADLENLRITHDTYPAPKAAEEVDLLRRAQHAGYSVSM